MTDTGKSLDLELHKQMLELRLFDELCRNLKLKDLVWSGYHPYEGQEAVAVGFCGTLTRDDVLLSTHRPHCHAVAKGCSMRSVLAEMMGRTSGCSGGLGGAMQFLDVDNNFYCGSIVGSNLPIATGIGLGIKQKKMDRVCVCMFGDGASNTGSFHEALNLAAIWKLPVLFVCENNGFAEAMPVEEFVACERIGTRALGYGLEEIVVDGNDPVETRSTALSLIERIKSGEGPFLVEAVTRRVRGHYMGDPEATYRTKEEIERTKREEPLKRSAEKLAQQGVTQDQLDAMERDMQREMDALAEWASNEAFPTFEQATDHVYIPLEGAAACQS